MEAEQPCRYCKRVHYSIYTAERCAARHQVSRELSVYLSEERRKQPKPAGETAGKKLARSGSLH